MADEQEYPSFNLGIMNDEVYGNIKDADAFLNDTAAVLTEAEELEDKNKPEVKPKQEVKPVIKEEEIDKEKLLNSFLGAGEEDDEEEEEIVETKPKVEETEENAFESFSKELYNLDFFTVPEGEEPVIPKSGEELLDLMNKEKQLGATIWLQNYLSKHGDDRKELFEAIFVDGVDPKDYLPVYNEVQSFENLALDNEKNQELVLRTYYKRAGWSDEKIEGKIDKLKSYSDLEDEAATVHPILVEQDKRQLESLREEKAEQNERILAQEEEYKASITKVLQEKIKEKQFDGIPLTDKDAKKAYDFLQVKKWKTPSGELLTDFDKFILESKRPENIAQRTKIALLALNNFDFSKIEKKAVAKESTTLFSSLATQKSKKSNTQPVQNNVWR